MCRNSKEIFPEEDSWVRARAALVFLMWPQPCTQPRKRRPLRKMDLWWPTASRLRPQCRAATSSGGLVLCSDDVWQRCERSVGSTSGKHPPPGRPCSGAAPCTGADPLLPGSVILRPSTAQEAQLPDDHDFWDYGLEDQVSSM